MATAAALAKIDLPPGVYALGDIKSGVQASDHSGWIRLDGRIKTSLTATQQTRATALGIGANIPDARDRGVVHFSTANSKALLSTGGSETKTIAQANLPNINLSGGAHGHGVSIGTHTHGLSFWYWSTTNRFLSSGGSGTQADAYYTATAASSSGISIVANSISVPLGGSGSALNVVNKYFAANFFIFLGA
jgi:microcystin-dependent protein